MLPLLASVALAAPSIDQPLRTQASRPHDAAVVVGIESYPFLPQVDYALRDAHAAYQLMVYTLGIPAERVAHLQGGGREQILAAVRRASDQVGEEGTLWIWFAGHGAASEAGELMLLGDDARPDPVAFAQRSVTVSELGREHPGPVNLFIDACWSGEGRGGEALLPGSRFAVPAWAPTGDEGLRLWTAASSAQRAEAYPAVQHGAFTYFAVGALRGWADGELDGQRDGVVTAAEAQAYVARMLPAVQVREQSPRWEGPGEIALSAGRNLERAPSLEQLPPAVIRAAVPSARPQEADGILPPIRYLGRGEYEDGARRRLTYDDVRRETLRSAPVQRVYANAKLWNGLQASGWTAVGVGALTGLVGLAVDAGRMDAYKFDKTVYDESRRWCEDSPTTCLPHTEPVRPNTGQVPMVGAAMAGAGAALVISGSIGKRGHRARVARVVSEELRR